VKCSAKEYYSLSEFTCTKRKREIWLTNMQNMRYVLYGKHCFLFFLFFLFNFCLCAYFSWFDLYNDLYLSVCSSNAVYKPCLLCILEYHHVLIKFLGTIRCDESCISVPRRPTIHTLYGRISGSQRTVMRFGEAQISNPDPMKRTLLVTEKVVLNTTCGYMPSKRK